MTDEAAQEALLNAQFTEEEYAKLPSGGAAALLNGLGGGEIALKFSKSQTKSGQRLLCYHAEDEKHLRYHICKKFIPV